MSGLKINFDKSEVVVTGVTLELQHRIAGMLNCKRGVFPIKYLGLPISDKALRVADWNFLPEKIGHRVDPWQGLFLASAGRLELTNSCLSSLPQFAMSLYMLFDSTHKAMDKPRCRFFWEGVGNKRKYHMVDWATVCKPKAFGGLGILNTKLMNIALMLKWIWKLYQDAEGLWADIIRAKYLRGRDLFDGNVPVRGSQFWNSIQKIKWYFKLGAKHGARNGRRTRFWLDWWTGRGPFMARFPLLFGCCTDPLISVADAAPREGTPGDWNVEFRRPFGTAEAVEWDNLCRQAMGWRPGAEEDTVSWPIDASAVEAAKLASSSSSTSDQAKEGRGRSAPPAKIQELSAPCREERRKTASASSRKEPAASAVEAASASLCRKLLLPAPAAVRCGRRWLREEGLVVLVGGAGGSGEEEAGSEGEGERGKEEEEVVVGEERALRAGREEEEGEAVGEQAVGASHLREGGARHGGGGQRAREGGDHVGSCHRPARARARSMA
ncbi:hypothetical protein QYE76_064158 [Lolium multiflorum]|uniref:Uncharacterized protein n=1 Tax=Lolium multiflorum TaxID=4521 RepID=A0AAD8W7Q1_LOLMU|nr:hypothetical protein QYE76_064158 [Lolium multiflorum]